MKPKKEDMKIYRIFPHTGTIHAYIQYTGISWEIVQNNILGEKTGKIDIKEMVIKNKTKIFPDFIGTGRSEFFLSERFKIFLQKKISNQEINFIETKIKDKKYWFLNIIGLRECMDYDKSEFTVYEKNNEPDKITKLVIYNDKVAEFDIFRIKEKPVNVFVTEALKNEIEKLKITGIKFIDTMDLTKM